MRGAALPRGGVLMSLGGIALGAYVPGNSVVHRLDARVKVVLLLAVTIALFCVGSPVALVVALAGALLLSALAGVPFGRTARNLLPMTIVFAVMLLANTLRFDGSGDIVLFGTFGLSTAGALRGLSAVVRIVCMVALALLVSSTTTVPALTESLLCLLAPLRRLRVPVDDIATTLSIALRFIPVCAEQLDRVATAQRARGAKVGQGSLVHRVTSWVPVMIPLIVGLFRRSEALASAMQARCYRGEGRTRLTTLRLRAVDVAVLVAGLAVCVVAGVLL